MKEFHTLFADSRYDKYRDAYLRERYGMPKGLEWSYFGVERNEDGPVTKSRLDKAFDDDKEKGRVKDGKAPQVSSASVGKFVSFKGAPVLLALEVKI